MYVCMYILMNHYKYQQTRLAVIVSQNRQTCSKSHHLYSLHSTRRHAIVNRVEVRRGGQSLGGIKSGVSYSSSATMCLWHDVTGHCPAERRKTRFQMPHGCYRVCFRRKSIVPGTKISDVDELKRRIKNDWADLNHEWRHVCALAFALEADISSI